MRKRQKESTVEVVNQVGDAFQQSLERWNNRFSFGRPELLKRYLDKIPDYQLEVLLSEGIVYEDEVVEYFFSRGVLSVREGGSVITNQRVITYYAGEIDEIDVYHIYVEDIGSVDLVQQGDAMNYSVYKVTTHDGEEWLELWLPHEYGDDKRFITAVETKIQE